MSTVCYKTECHELPKNVSDASMFAMLLLAWKQVLSMGGGKSAAAFRALGEWLADEQEYHEHALDRVAIRKLVSTWASKVRGKQANFLASMPKRQGQMPNPYFVVDAESGRTYADVVLANLWKTEKSEVSLKLNAATNVRATTGRKDANDNPLAPVNLNLARLSWTEELNARVDNVYRVFIPSASDPVATSDETIADCWTV